MKNRKAKLLIIILAALLIAGAGVWAAFATGFIVRFDERFQLSNAESLTIKLKKGELSKLDGFPKLKYADLSGSEDFEEIERWAAEHPQIDVDYNMSLPEGAYFDRSSASVDLSALNAEDALAAAENANKTLKAQYVKLALNGWTAEQIVRFSEKCPRLQMTGDKELDGERGEDYLTMLNTAPLVNYSGTLGFGGVKVPVDTPKADVEGISAEGIDELDSFIRQKDIFQEIDFGSERTGHTKLERIYSFAMAHPQVKVDYYFDAFGKRVGLKDKKLDLNHKKMTDQGEEVRQIISCMPELTYLDMDSCGVDDKHMAAIRKDFPNVEVVWRVWFGDKKTYSVRTDVKKILASAYGVDKVTSKSSSGLKYCTKVKYLDLGHNGGLQNISFVANMPDLEVFIVIMGNVADISPLAKCPKLEFLEIQTNAITDLSPLKDLKGLKHLNIGWNFNLKDISPLYGLTNLERLWIGNRTKVPQSQVDKFKKLVPGCTVDNVHRDPHTNWRGNHPRYKLLVQQLGYNTKDYAYYWKDPLYEARKEPSGWEEYDAAHNIH